MGKNILIYTHMPFSFTNGGTVAEYLLAKLLETYNQTVRIYSPTGYKIANSIFSKYYNNDFPIDDDTIVIYCEGTIGNPLNAKKVVRWMLSELGQNVPHHYVDTWGKNELVYYYNSELKFDKEPEKVGSIYKLLSCIYINPYAKQYNFNKRNGVCFTVRKANEIHKNGFRFVHPKNAFEITRSHTQMKCIEFFNNYEWFITYDSLTFLTVIAALCGCIPVVYKVNGLNKQQWIQTTAAAEYVKYKGIDNLYGIAYGREDMQYAASTLHLAKEQWIEIINYCVEKTVIPFIKDIQNFDSLINTIQNNYY
jgi:hypothetical protein